MGKQTTRHTISNLLYIQTYSLCYLYLKSFWRANSLKLLFRFFCTQIILINTDVRLPQANVKSLCRQNKLFDSSCIYTRILRHRYIQRHYRLAWVGKLIIYGIEMSEIPRLHFFPKLFFITL